METRKYWPFSVLPLDEQTEQHKKEIWLLNTATHLGFRAYVFGSNFGVEDTSGRIGEIIHRGGNRRWEILLSASETLAGKKMVDDFDAAARAVLRWLKGEDATSSLGRGERG
jgi:hypothetical protein